MSVKIRLQRHGKKGKPFYWIVAADARAKRDGRYLQKLGTYNPNTNPATINLDVDKSVKWLQFGAQPTDTARNILSYKGVLMKNHLKNGVRKGALTEEQVEERFEEWLNEKSTSIDNKKSSLDKLSPDSSSFSFIRSNLLSTKTNAKNGIINLGKSLCLIPAPIKESAVDQTFDSYCIIFIFSPLWLIVLPL